MTIALSNNDGDKLFTGYEHYYALWLNHLLHHIFPIHKMPSINLIQQLPDSNRQHSIIHRGKRFLEAIDQPDTRHYLNWLQIFPESIQTNTYTNDFLTELPGEDPFEFLEAI